HYITAYVYHNVKVTCQYISSGMRVPYLRKHDIYPKLPNGAIVVPAINELCGGRPVNDIRARFLGPLFDEELVRVDDAAVHLHDGTHLGRLRDIRVDLGFRPEDYRQ